MPFPVCPEKLSVIFLTHLCPWQSHQREGTRTETQLTNVSADCCPPGRPGLRPHHVQEPLRPEVSSHRFHASTNTTRRTARAQCCCRGFGHEVPRLSKALTDGSGTTTSPRLPVSPPSRSSGRKSAFHCLSARAYGIPRHFRAYGTRGGGYGCDTGEETLDLGGNSGRPIFVHGYWKPGKYEQG